MGSVERRALVTFEVRLPYPSPSPPGLPLPTLVSSLASTVGPAGMWGVAPPLSASAMVARTGCRLTGGDTRLSSNCCLKLGHFGGVCKWLPGA